MPCDLTDWPTVSYSYRLLASHVLLNQLRTSELQQTLLINNARSSRMPRSPPCTKRPGKASVHISRGAAGGAPRSGQGSCRDASAGRQGGAGRGGKAACVDQSPPSQQQLSQRGARSGAEHTSEGLLACQSQCPTSSSTTSICRCERRCLHCSCWPAGGGRWPPGRAAGHRHRGAAPAAPAAAAHCAPQRRAAAAACSTRPACPHCQSDAPQLSAPSLRSVAGRPSRRPPLAASADARGATCSRLLPPSWRPARSGPWLPGGLRGLPGCLAAWLWSKGHRAVCPGCPGWRPGLLPARGGRRAIGAYVAPRGGVGIGPRGKPGPFPSWRPHPAPGRRGCKRPRYELPARAASSSSPNRLLVLQESSSLLKVRHSRPAARAEPAWRGLPAGFGPPRPPEVLVAMQHSRAPMPAMVPLMAAPLSSAPPRTAAADVRPRDRARCALRGASTAGLAGVGEQGWG